MLFLSRTSSSLVFSLQIVLLSTGLLSTAIMLKFSLPAITEFAVFEIPSVINAIVSWFKPPYLYLVINCIIITIVASSKFQSEKYEVSSTIPLQPPDSLETAAHIQPQIPMMPVAENPQILPSINEYKHDDNKENESVDAKSDWTEKNSPEYSFSNEKSNSPPVSARFRSRRNIKASPEGGKSVLGVLQPSKQDTLESTWRTITGGHAMPSKRHLKKSDTWERNNHTHGRRHHHLPPQQQEKTLQKMTKSNTFTDHTNASSPLLTPSPSGTGKLKKEASPSHDELNRRVEAFIKKFNEEMRLQRQESFNQYKEMINRASN